MDQHERVPAPPAVVVQFHVVEILPHWEQGVPGVLCAEGPHAIPVSTAVRAGDRGIVFALGRGRDTLALLRDDPRTAFCLLAPGAAFTAYGRTTVLREELESAPNVAALALAVDEIQDHLEGSRTEILEAARWRWTEGGAADDERRIVTELRGLAGPG
jgi:hypothetical protein